MTIIGFSYQKLFFIPFYSSIVQSIDAHLKYDIWHRCDAPILCGLVRAYFTEPLCVLVLY